MIDISKISEYTNVIIVMVSAIFGGLSTWAFDKLRKRTEEVSVTGVEHDTVKRISQSSIETIERLNSFAEDMSDKILKQRQDFSIKIQSLSDEITNLNVIINSQNTELFNMKGMISDLQTQNNQLIVLNKNLQDKLNGFTNPTT